MRGACHDKRFFLLPVPKCLDSRANRSYTHVNRRWVAEAPVICFATEGDSNEEKDEERREEGTKEREVSLSKTI